MSDTVTELLQALNQMQHERVPQSHGLGLGTGEDRLRSCEDLLRRLVIHLEAKKKVLLPLGDNSETVGDSQQEVSQAPTEIGFSFGPGVEGLASADSFSVAALRQEPEEAVSDGVFPITLTQTGGAQGDEDSPATWTYGVSDLNGKELGTAVDPTASPHKWVRPGAGQMSSATFGYAHWNGTELVIGWINEQLIQEKCDAEAEE